MNDTSRKILMYLMKQDDFVKTKIMSFELNIPVRTVRAHLSKLETLFENQELKLLREPTKGIFIKEKDEVSSKLLEGVEYYDNPYLEIDYQKLLLMSLLLNEDYYIKAEQFGNRFFLSTSTIKYYIKRNRLYLKGKDISLKYEPSKGYHVVGERLDKVLLFTRIFIETYDISEFYQFMKNNGSDEYVFFNQLFDNKLLSSSMAVVNKLESISGIQLDDLHYLNLCFILYPYMDKEIDSVANIGSDIKDTKVILKMAGVQTNSSVWHVFEKTFEEYISTATTDYPDDFLDITNQLCDNVQRKYDYDIRDNKILFPLFLKHVYLLIKRNQRGAILTNELLLDVTQQYEELYNDLKIEGKLLEKYYTIELSDYDISLLSLYFATAFSNKREMKAEDSKKKLLVICKEGKIVSQFQKSVLMAEFGNFLEVDIGSMRDYNKSHLLTYDLVIRSSQNKAQNMLPNELLVNSVLSQKDLKKIAKRLNYTNVIGNSEVTNEILELYKIIQDNCEIITKEKLDLDLIRYFSNNNIINGGGRVDKYTFKKELNQYIYEEVNWQESINISMKPLLEHALITQNYIDKVISNIKEYGPYMMVAPGILIAHAGVRDGVLENVVNMTVFDRSIDIQGNIAQENTFIKVIIVTAFDEQSVTDSIVQSLIKLVNDRETMSKIINSKSVTEIFNAGKKYL